MLLLTDGSDTVWYATSVRDILEVGHSINTETTGTKLTRSAIPFGAHLEPSKISKFAILEYTHFIIDIYI